MSSIVRPWAEWHRTGRSCEYELAWRAQVFAISDGNFTAFSIFNYKAVKYLTVMINVADFWAQWMNFQVVWATPGFGLGKVFSLEADLEAAASGLYFDFGKAWQRQVLAWEKPSDWWQIWR